MRVRVPRAVSGMDLLKASSASYSSHEFGGRCGWRGGGLASAYDATILQSALRFSPARRAAVRSSFVILMTRPFKPCCATLHCPALPPETPVHLLPDSSFHTRFARPEQITKVRSWRLRLPKSTPPKQWMLSFIIVLLHRLPYIESVKCPCNFFVVRAEERTIDASGIKGSVGSHRDTTPPETTSRCARYIIEINAQKRIACASSGEVNPGIALYETTSR